MTVYVVQEPTRKIVNQFTGEVSYEKKYDLRAAEAFGQLDVLLPSGADPSNSKELCAILRSKLASFSDEDHILAIGHPALLAWSVAIAAAYNEGRVSVLCWASQRRLYMPVVAELYEAGSVLSD